MLAKLQNHRPAQLLIGFIIGIFFGFFLQKGQVTKYEAIFGQLLLIDFTVIKVMLTAIVVGMAGVYGMRTIGLVELNIKPGSWGASGVGGVIFGVGLAILGYCPGTSAGAAGQGSMDALIGGVGGMIAGAMLYTRIYPKIANGVLKWGEFGRVTVPEWLRVKLPAAALGISVIVILLLTGLEMAGL
jgi:Na+/H+-dicarboxylate symporter